MPVVEEAITRVSVGPEKKSRKVTEKDKNLVAYHEAGHAVVSYYIPECDPVHEVSIIPRGSAGGYTMSLPKEETNYITKAHLLGDMCSSLGGNCAEKLILGDVSTGATSDLKHATKIARSMVTHYGMSEKLGHIFLGDDHEVFLGRDFSQSRSYSEEVAAQVDREVHDLLESSYQRATDILTRHMDKLHALAACLIEKEKLDAKEFKELMERTSVEAATE